MAISLLLSMTANAAKKTKIAKSDFVTVKVENPTANGAKWVRLQVMNDNIIRVEATPEDDFPSKTSLIIVPQNAKPVFSVKDENGKVTVEAKKVKAVVDKKTGEVNFFDANGKLMLKEAKGGKTFQPFRVPEREIGIGTLTEEQRNGFTWRALFDSPDDEAFYGLGQHQAEDYNMKGVNEDLFQYNTKVSIPFVLSNRNYGILWDSYSYCRWGNPNEYLQLNRAFKLYDKNGKPGHLTGTYVDKDGKKLVRDEDSIYYEFDCPATSAIANQTEPGGIKNLPKGFNLDGAHVVYEGFIEAPETNLYHFILYYAGYTKIYIMDRVVAIRN